MRTSTQIETASVLVGEEKAVEYVAKAGFDAWDFSMFAMCDYDWRLGAVRPTTHPPQKMPKCTLNCCRLRRTAA